VGVSGSVHGRVPKLGVGGCAEIHSAPRKVALRGLFKLRADGLLPTTRLRDRVPSPAHPRWRCRAYPEGVSMREYVFDLGADALIPKSLSAILLMVVHSSVSHHSLSWKKGLAAPFSARIGSGTLVVDCNNSITITLGD
jgi:hypothetical protein